MKKIILASASPRRRELLEKYNIKFEILPLDIDESVSGYRTPEDLVLKISDKKAKAAVKSVKPEDLIIIAADTVVSIDCDILGKPNDEADAARMLRKLSGRINEVYTGVTIVFLEYGKVTFEQISCCTRVKFHILSEKDIDKYIKTGEPMDKAGAYAIQGLGSSLIESVDGDYESAIGLPVKKVIEIINNYRTK